VIIRRLGRVDYAATFAAMQDFTAQRGEDTPDELWLCEHPPVFTQGLSGKPEHLLRDIGIPSCRSTAADRSPITAPASSSPTCCSTSSRRELKVRELVS
jgi:lipoyl(octanoyl) transferase